MALCRAERHLELGNHADGQNVEIDTKRNLAIDSRAIGLHIELVSMMKRVVSSATQGL